MPAVTVSFPGTPVAPMTASFTVSSLQFGVTVGANDSRLPSTITPGSAAALSWAAQKTRAALGRDLGCGVKVFGTSGIEAAESKWHAAGIFEPRPLLTNEVWDPPALDRVMSRLTQAVDVCWRQEFMDKVITASDFDTWLGQYADLRAQIDDHPNGHLVWLRMVGNEAVERQNTASPIWRKVIDRMPERCGIGNDTYATQSGMLDPAKGMKGSLDWFAAASQTVPGTTLDISESGFSAVNFTPQQRADAMQAYRDKLAAVGARSYSYWATCNLDKGPANDWSFDQSGQEIVAAKAASLIAA